MVMIKSIIGAVLFSFVVMGLPTVMDMDVPHTTVCVGDTPHDVPQYSEVVYEDCQMKRRHRGIHNSINSNSDSRGRSSLNIPGAHYVRS